MSILEEFARRSEERYAAELAEGTHDGDCESRPRARFCNCSMRRRIASGLTEPPELEHQYPLCSNCWREVSHDGDCYVCERCHVSWGDGETVGHFNDDYGPFQQQAGGGAS